ncbi:hypothetical protein ACFQX9_27550, partial [Bradyrhizobium sp. GCM10028915]|uniref:hypothetical protein n=1 Tax=Bradyrhizobium sp. GCM10028915 TaxID=3273385 RepID=UPI0036227A4A
MALQNSGTSDGEPVRFFRQGVAQSMTAWSSFRQSPQISPTRFPQSIFRKAAMSQYSLDELRRRYVVEKRPLEASIEQ